MGFNVQLSDVAIADVGKSLDSALKDAVTPDLGDDDKRTLEHAADYVKTVLDRVALDKKSKVYIAIQGEAGQTAEGTRNWLNISVTETVRNPAKVTPPEAAPAEEPAVETPPADVPVAESPPVVDVPPATPPLEEDGAPL